MADGGGSIGALVAVELGETSAPDVQPASTTRTTSAADLGIMTSSLTPDRGGTLRRRSCYAAINRERGPHAGGAKGSGGTGRAWSSRRDRASSQAGPRPHRRPQSVADAGFRRRGTPKPASLEPPDEPGGARRSGALRPKTPAQVAVVGHNEELGGRFRACGRPDVLGKRQDHEVGASRAGIANADAGRDALASEPSFRRAVEDQLDCRRRRDDRPQAADQCGRRLRLVAP